MNAWFRQFQDTWQGWLGDSERSDELLDTLAAFSLLLVLVAAARLGLFQSASPATPRAVASEQSAQGNVSPKADTSAPPSTVPDSGVTSAVESTRHSDLAPCDRTAATDIRGRSQSGRGASTQADDLRQLAPRYHPTTARMLVPQPPSRTSAQFRDTGRRPSDSLTAAGLSALWGGRNSEAADVLRKVIHHDPENALALYLLALSKRRSGDVDEAERLLTVAVNLERSHPVPSEKWGRWMERIQGPDRNWIETARRRAAVAHYALR